MPINSINLSVMKGDSPLARLSNSCLERSDVKKARMLSHLIDGFHLKNTVTTTVSDRITTINGRRVINFGSVNYLGLDQHPAVLLASVQALDKWGNHSGCSRMFSTHENMFQLEEAISGLVDSEKTLVLPNTAQTHMAVIPSLFSTADAEIFVDRHAHVSMYQAALVAKAKGATLTKVNTSEVEDLQSILEKSTAAVKVLLIDGLYSMQGTLPDILSLQKMCDKAGTVLYIDDAHGIGIFGENGGGVRELFDLSFDNMILTGTLQKGLGCFGGFVSAKSQIIDILRVTSVAYIFSGTLQPHTVEGALAAIDICRSNEGKILRARLKESSLWIRQQLRDLGFEVGAGDSPIIPVMSHGDIKTLLAGRFLFDEGVFLNSVLYPAVPKGEGILRISVTALHTREDCENLMQAFGKLRAYWKSSAISRKNFQYAEEILREQAKNVMRGFFGTPNTL